MAEERNALTTHLLAALLIPIMAAGCTGPANPGPAGAGMANPASVFCEQQGGRLEIRAGGDGQAGYCHLPDGRMVEEWEFYRAGQAATVPEVERITEKYWKLVELNGRPVPSLDREPHVIFKADGGRVNGYSGCNGFSGNYSQNEATFRISITQIVSTERACATGMDVEQAFTAALANADNYSLNGDHLTLNRARMAPLARFEVVWLQ